MEFCFQWGGEFSMYHVTNQRTLGPCALSRLNPQEGHSVHVTSASSQCPTSQRPASPTSFSLPRNQQHKPPPTPNPRPFSKNFKQLHSVPMSLFFKSPLDIEIRLKGEDQREHVDIKTDKGRREKYPLYLDGETVKGSVTIRPRDGKKLEHTGIKVQFIGSIGMFDSQKHRFSIFETNVRIRNEQ